MEKGDLMADQCQHYSLDQLTAHLGDLYLRHNRLRNDGLLDLAAWLLVQGSVLARSIRRGHPESAPKLLANITGWNCGLVNYFGNSFAGQTIAFWMASKYPAGSCAYCWRLPCVCRGDRPAPKLSAAPLAMQIDWDLRQWQNHLAHCYGAVNRQSGINAVMARLFEEIGEVVVFIKMLPITQAPLHELERKLAEEITDVFAWTSAAADLLSIDWRAAMNDRYRQCPECGQVPCYCGHLALERSAYISRPVSPSTVISAS